MVEQLPTRRRRLLRLSLSVLLAAVAVAVYAVWIPLRHPDGTRLTQLVVQRFPGGFSATPASSGSVPSTSSQLTAVKKAAKRTPDATASFSAQWSASAKSALAEVLVVIVPTVSEAKEVQTEAKKRYLGASSLKTAGYTLDGHFTVPSVQGAEGATFTSTSSTGTSSTGTSSTGTSSTGTSSTGTSHTAVVVLRSGRVVSLAFAEEKGSAVRSDVSSYAKAEQRLVERRIAGFSLVTTVYPLVASVVYGCVSVVVVVVGVWGPGVVRRIRRRRRRAREEAVRRQRLSRGHKVVRHHGRRF